jgi:hypothetical protein
MEAAVVQYGLNDREEFVGLAVRFAISHLREKRVTSAYNGA